MTINAVGTALPIYIESTAGPTESSQFRAVGFGSATFATNQVTALATIGAFCFVVCVGAGAAWNALFAVIGAIVAAILAWNVVRRIQRRGHRGPNGTPGVFVGVAVTTQRVVGMAAAQNAAPVLTMNRPRTDLRGVCVGTAKPRWYVAPIAVVRVLLHDGTAIEFLTPGVPTDGTESALRLAGIAVFDLDGVPHPRPEFPPTGFVPVAPRRVSTPAQARAKVLSCGLLGVVLFVSMFGGFYLGAALVATATTDRPAESVRQQCVSQVAQAVDQGDRGESVVSYRLDSTTEFGRGTLMVGAVQVDGSLGQHDVDFTCAQQDDGISVAIAD